MSHSVGQLEDCEDGQGLGIKGICFKSSLSELETFMLIILWLKFSF